MLWLLGAAPPSPASPVLRPGSHSSRRPVLHSGALWAGARGKLLADHPHSVFPSLLPIPPHSLRSAYGGNVQQCALVASSGLQLFLCFVLLQEGWYLHFLPLYPFVFYFPSLSQKGRMAGVLRSAVPTGCLLVCSPAWCFPSALLRCLVQWGFGS